MFLEHIKNYYNKFKFPSINFIIFTTVLKPGTILKEFIWFSQDSTFLPHPLVPSFSSNLLQPLQSHPDSAKKQEMIAVSMVVDAGLHY